VLILWLGDDDIGTLLRQCNGLPSGMQNIYLSGSLIEWPGNLLLSDSWLHSVRMVYPFELAERRTQRLSADESLACIQNIPQLDERIQSSTYFAVIITGDALTLNGE